MTKEYTNYPNKVDISFYEKARKNIINYFIDDKNLKSIYEYGTIRAPGVSDIDMILVFDSVPTNIEKYNFRGINNDVYNLVANGNVMKMGMSTFSCLNYIDYFNLKLIYGTPIQMSLISNDIRARREIISICDWLPERIKRIEKCLSNPILNISNTLCLLQSVTYSIKNVEKLTNEIDYSKELFEFISTLRTNWYRLKEPERLLEEALIMSIEVALKSISKITETLINTIPLNHLHFKFSPNQIVVPMHLGIDLKFSDELPYDSLNLFREKRQILFPGILAYHYLNLAHLPTLISRRLSKKLFKHQLNPILDLDNKYINSLYIKASLISDNLYFLEESKFKGGLIRYGFYA